jgi:purine-cytosine permease-like protein
MVEDYGNRARIDHFPKDDRHGRVSHQGPFWLVGNFQPFTLAVSFVRPSPGLSLYWSIVAGIAGIAFGTLFMASHATQGPVLGLPQMIQSRAQFGFRGLLLPLIGTLFTFVGFNDVDVVIIKSGLQPIFGWNPVVVAAAITVIAALLAIFGHDLLHKSFRAAPTATRQAAPSPRRRTVRDPAMPSTTPAAVAVASGGIRARMNGFARRPPQPRR